MEREISSDDVPWENLLLFVPHPLLLFQGHAGGLLWGKHAGSGDFHIQAAKRNDGQAGSSAALLLQLVLSQLMLTGQEEGHAESGLAGTPGTEHDIGRI